MLGDDIKKLIKEAKSGNRESFGRIYEEYLTPIYRFLYFRLSSREEAEDLTQEVFLRIFRNLDKLDLEKGSLLAYFYTVAKHLLIDSYRKNKFQSVDTDILEETLASGENIEEETSLNYDILKLKRALGEISGNEREALTLKFISNYSNAEIADLMQKSEEAVRQLQSRGIKSLKNILQKEKFF